MTDGAGDHPAERSGDQPDEHADERFEHWLSVGATVVAPATVLSAVLFYFGYVSARAQYEYFGVDVDTIGLSTRDYVMRSPQPLLVPLLALTGLGIAVAVGHAALRSRVRAVITSADESDLARLRRLTSTAVRLGAVLLGTGIALLLAYVLVRDWWLYNLVTPLLIGTGLALSVYASRVRQQLSAPPGGRRTPPPLTSTLLLRRSALILVGVVAAACVFWATATVAQWSGRGLARYSARHLDRLPTVILDTKERLFLTAGCRHAGRPGEACIDETALPASPGQTYRYRYRHLRLLIQGHDRMFLVPDVWSASDSTVVVPFDDSVRVQFQFQNDPP